MKKITLFLMLLFCIPTLLAQVVDIGTGTSTQRYPLGNFYGYERSASIYNSNEIGRRGNILNVAWYANTAGQGNRPIKIYIKETPDNTFTATNWATAITGATLLYDTSMTPVQGWNQFVLNTPFNYSGNQNLVVLVEANYGGSGNSGGSTGNSIRYSNVGVNKHLYFYEDGSAPTGSGSVDGLRPNIQLTFDAASTTIPCLPSNLSMIDVSTTTANIQLVGVGTPPQNGYEYEVRTSGSAGSGATGRAQQGTLLATATTVALTDLLPNTSYTLYVRSHCETNTFNNWTAQTFTTVALGVIGVGETTTTTLPIVYNYGYTYSQQLYTAAEVATALNGNHMITNIGFHVDIATSSNSNTYKDWEIFIGNTTKNQYGGTSVSEWIPVSQMQRVFDAEVNFPNPTRNWMSIDLASPFIWDGTSNIVVAVLEKTPSYSTGVSFRQHTTTGQYRALYYRSDSVLPNPAAPPTGSGRAEFVPQLKLVGQQTPSCVMPLNLEVQNITTESAVLSWNHYNATGILGIEYYISTTNTPPVANQSGVVFVDVATLQATIGDLLDNTTYYVWARTKCSATELSAWSSQPLRFTTNIVGLVGSGVATTTYLPMTMNYGYNYSQQIYLASEVEAAVGGNLMINKVMFYFTSNGNSNQNHKDWGVYVGNTTKGSFGGTSISEWVPPSELTQVFNGELSFPDPNGGWMEIEFTEPYLWDGVSNLVIGVHEYTPSYTSGGNFRSFDTGSTYRGMIYRSDTVNPDPSSPPAASTRYQLVPQIVLTGNPLPGCVYPLGVRVDSFSTTEAEIVWNNIASQDRLGLEYYISTSDFGPDDTMAGEFLAGDITSLELTDLTPDTTYYVWVRTKCTATEYSDWSNGVSFTTIPLGQIGTGTASAGTLPLSSNYNFNYSQQIYLASEIGDVLGTEHYITAIRFYVESLPATTEESVGWKVYMGNTTQSAFSGTTAWVPSSQFSMVFNGDVSYPTVSGRWITITLDTPFLWDGTSNLAVGVNEVTPGKSVAPTMQFGTFATTGYRGMMIYTDASNPNTMSPQTASARYQYVNRIVLTSETAPTCIAVPTTTYSDLTINSVKLEWTNMAGYLGVEYYLSASNTPPTAATEPTASVEAPTLETVISDLQPDTPYFVWFKNVCSTTEDSGWSVHPLEFRTLERGLIGVGETTNTQLPIYSTNNYNYSQQIYLQSELVAAFGGGTPQYITSLKFHIRNTGTAANFKDWKILIGNTTKSAFASTAASEWVALADLQQVFDGEVTFPNPTDDWMVITLTEPFVWDGTSNLVVAVNEYTPGWSSGANFRKHDVTTNRGRIYTQDGANFNFASPQNANSNQQYVPQVVFGTSAMPTCFPVSNIVLTDIMRYGVTAAWDLPFQTPGMGYEYEVRTSGQPGSGATGRVLMGNVTVGLQAVLAGLTPSTEYTVYIRSKCSATDFSPWRASSSFMTLCAFPDVTVVTPEELCGVGTTILRANVNQGTVKWYESELGNAEAIGEELVFQTPELTETTSFWVQAFGDGSTIGNVGAGTPGGTSNFETTNWGMVFDVAQSVRLDNVSVYARGTGAITLAVLNAAGTELFATPSIAITDAEYNVATILPLGFDLEPGTSYRIIIKAYSGISLVRDSSGLSFPYTSEDGAISLTASYNGSPTTGSYYWFYNIQYSRGCSGPREEVVVIVNEAPAFELSETELVLCAGTPSQSVTILEGADDYDVYVWTPATGVTGNAQTGWIFNPAETTEYTLRASSSIVGNTCKAKKVLNVTVNPIPEASFEVEETDLVVCEEDILSLSVELLGASDPTEEILGEARTMSGTTDNNTVFNNRWNSGKSQMLYLASELNDLGMNVGTEIQAISFEIATLGDRDFNNNYTVKIGTTTLNEMGTAYVTTGLETVFGPVTYTHTATGWQEIVFDTPYIWDGVSNLIIEISMSGANLTYSSQTYYTVTTANSLLYSYNTVSPTRTKNRYNTKFKYLGFNKVSWTLSDNLYVDEAATVLYDGEEDVLQVYYKGDVEGYETITGRVETALGCFIERTYSIRTAFMTPPVVNTAQEFCGAIPITEVEIDGQEGATFLWYATETATTPLAANYVISATATYYVTQKIGACIYPQRTAVSILIKDKPINPIVTGGVVCGGSLFSEYTVGYNSNNTLHWYDADDNEILNHDTPMVTGTYFVSQRNLVCESDKVQIEIAVNPFPASPVSERQLFCQETRISDLAVELLPNGVANWYDSENSVIRLTSNTIVRTGTYYVSQTVNGCDSQRVAVVIEAYDRVPMVNAQNQSYCSAGNVVGDLVVSNVIEGATVSWYRVATGGTPINPAEVLATGIYYVGQKIGSCESVRTRIGVTIVNNNTAPWASEVQEFCGSPVVWDLSATVATGMVVKWYAVETGGTPLLSHERLSNGVYYASQTIYNCESPRTAVQVVIHDVPMAPTGEATQTFEVNDNARIADLVLDQNNIVWYSSIADATNDRNRLSTNMPLQDGYTYYAVSITAEGCRSETFAVTVVIVDPTMGMEDFDLSKLNYYPNPVIDLLTISYSENIKTIEVYDMNSKLVLRQNYDDQVIQIDMSSVASGNYMIRILSSVNTQFIKVIKK